MSFLRVVAACLVACLAALPLVPAAHVHETDHEDGSHGFVVHSHSGSHRHDAAHHRHDASPRHHDEHDVACWRGCFASPALRDPHRDQWHHANHDGVNLDDADSVIATLDPVFAVPDITKWTTMALADEYGWPLAAPEPDASLVSPLIEPLIHGPPRAPATLRGPPSSSRL